MNASITTDTKSNTTAPLALWRVAEAFMHLLHALFGDPSHVAAKHTLTRKAHQLMASWLCAGEAMMRRLLLIEAAAHAKPNTRPLLRAPRKRKRKLMHFTAEAPEQWRVSSRCMDRRRPAGHLRCMPQRAPAIHNLRNRFRSAWPLAERYEALLRAFNDPATHARRLARRLYATPHRARELLRASPHAEHRIDNFDKLTEAAQVRVARFSSG